MDPYVGGEHAAVMSTRVSNVSVLHSFAVSTASQSLATRNARVMSQSNDVPNARSRRRDPTTARRAAARDPGAF